MQKNTLPVFTLIFCAESDSEVKVRSKSHV